MKPPIVATATITTMKPIFADPLPPLLILVVLLVVKSGQSTRDPDAARAVDRRSVREPAPRLDARERARVAQRAVRGHVERDDHALERIDVIEGAAVRREGGAVRDRARVDRGATDSAAIVQIDTAALRFLAVVHAAEPNAPGAVDRGVV